MHSDYGNMWDVHSCIVIVKQHECVNFRWCFSLTVIWITWQVAGAGILLDDLQVHGCIELLNSSPGSFALQLWSFH